MFGFGLGGTEWCLEPLLVAVEGMRGYDARDLSLIVMAIGADDGCA